MIIAWLITILFLFSLWWMAHKDFALAIGWTLACLPIYLVRLNIGPIPTTALELGIYWLVFLLYLKIYRKKITIKWNNFFILPLSWLIIGLVSSMFFSEQRISSLGLWKGWFVDPILFGWILINSLKIKKQIDYLYYGLLTLMGWMGWITLYQLFSGNGWSEDGRLAAVFESPNYLAMILLPVLLWTLSRIVLEKRFRILEIILWLLGFFGLVCSVSFVGIGGFILGLLILAWLYWKNDIKKLLLAVLGLTVLIGLFAVWQAGGERLQRMINLSDRSSVTVRMEVWRTDWGIIGDYLWTGIGLGNFEKKYLDYAPRYFHPPMEWRMLHGHNLFLHTWLSLGLFGLMIIIAILLAWYALTLKYFKKTGWWWLAGSLIVVIVWIATGMLDTPLYKNDLAVLWWVWVAVSIVSGVMYKKMIKTGDGR